METKMTLTIASKSKFNSNNKKLSQYSLASKETSLIWMSMVSKIIVVVAWTIMFVVFYSEIWAQRNHALRWSKEENKTLINYLTVILVLITSEILALLLFILPWDCCLQISSSTTISKSNLWSLQWTQNWRLKIFHASGMFYLIKVTKFLWCDHGSWLFMYFMDTLIWYSILTSFIFCGNILPSWWDKEY